MEEKVLFVDDDQKVLNGVTRQFEDVFEFDTANGPEVALKLIDSDGPYAIVVSDMRMPGMNGIELLTSVKERSSDTVRIMLTGYADLQATIEAVNQGNIFRFLSKPCPQDVLEKAVRDGLAQYRLVTAERELLEGTLHGSIKVLSEMLSLINPLAFGRTSQVQRIALAIGAEMRLESLWDLRIATMLFPLGYVTVSEKTLECVLDGRPVPSSDREALAHHAEIAQRMLRHIPRLESVASIVAYQDKSFDGSGNPEGGSVGKDIPLGARILKLASDFAIVYKRQGDTTLALEQLADVKRRYDEDVFQALQGALRNGLCQSSKREVAIQELVTGMVIATDVRASAGQLMASSGQEITESSLHRLHDWHEKGVIEGTIEVEVLGEVGASELATI